jgi:alpha-beta hydrolase superfamily lysophospholipase
VDVDVEPITDVLGEPYLAETIPLPPDDEGEVVATLVLRTAAALTGKAVLHLHGFADYFFQTGYAEWWCERGYDFYALDLRKYGRSLLPHQTPNYITDLRDYYPEIDAAWERVTGRDGHDEVILSAHSTGGLEAGLWADDRRPAQLAGAVMNSPWLDLQGHPLVRVISRPALTAIAARQPMREIRRTVTGHYTRSLHKDHDGEWEFNLLWKPVESFTVYAGWLRAIRDGHARLHRGLDLPCPVLVLSSGRSSVPEEMSEEVHGTDIVLDVTQIRRWATAYGPHITYVAIEGARHDVVLSREEPRRAAYDAISTWLTAWVDPPKRSLL